jgi:hypothetical protein
MARRVVDHDHLRARWLSSRHSRPGAGGPDRRVGCAVSQRRTADAAADAALQREITRHQADIAKARTEQEAEATSGAPSASKPAAGIAFGIQACKPIRIATVQ